MRSVATNDDFYAIKSYLAHTNPNALFFNRIAALNPSEKKHYSEGISHDDDLALLELAGHFSSLSYQEKLNFMGQLSAYSAQNEADQKQYERYDRTYDNLTFKSTALFKCLQYAISPYAVVKTIVQRNKCSKYRAFSPRYQVYKSRENNVKALTYQPLVFNSLVLAVAPFDGEVELPTNDQHKNAYIQQQISDSFRCTQEFKHAWINSCERIHQQHLENYIKNTLRNEPVECAVLHRRCTQEHACSNCHVGAQTIALNEQFKHFGFSDSWYTYRPSAAAFIAEHNLSQRDLIQIRESHTARPFRQHTSLTLGFVPERNIGFLFDWQKNTFITLFSCTKQQYETYFSEPVTCDFDHTKITKYKVFPEPLNAPIPLPPPIEIIVPQGVCGGSIVSTPPKSAPCGTGPTSLDPPLPQNPTRMPEPKPRDCNWGKGFGRYPSFSEEQQLEEIALDEAQQGESQSQPKQDEPTINDEEIKTKEAPTIQSATETIEDEEAEIETTEDSEEATSTITQVKPHDLERIDGDLKKQKHILFGSDGHDHQWELLAPDITWKDVRPFIKNVVETGEDGIPNGKELRKFKYINGYPVVVKYAEVDGKIRIGTAMIPKKENIHRYIPKDKIR
jgi:hypothetical protein